MEETTVLERPAAPPARKDSADDAFPALVWMLAPQAESMAVDQETYDYD